MTNPTTSPLKPIATNSKLNGHSRVLEHDGNTVNISNAGQIPIGTFVRFGNFIGVVTKHSRSLTQVTLYFEKEGARWGLPLRAVPSQLEVQQLTDEEWLEVQKSIYPKRIVIGNIRQAGISASAYFPPLAELRTLIIGTSGAGKTTTMMAILVGYRNAMFEYSKRLDSKTQKPVVPGLLAFDLKQDLTGNLRDADSVYRPNLQRCLKEEIYVYRFGELFCNLRDVPVDVVIQCLGKLSPAQNRWVVCYLNDQTGHDAIEGLMKDDQEWPSLFPEMTVQGKMPAANRDSLVALRSIFKSFFNEPLFSEKKQSNWKEAIDLLYQGKVVVVDLVDYGEIQRNFLAVLLMRFILHKQKLSVKLDQTCYPIVVAGPELHRLSQAQETIELFARMCRAYHIGFIFDSQDLADFPEIVGSVINRGIVLRTEGVSCERLLRRFPELKPYNREVFRLETGTGFLVGGNLAIPVSFIEPKLDRK